MKSLGPAIGGNPARRGQRGVHGAPRLLANSQPGTIDFCRVYVEEFQLHTSGHIDL